jgi:glucose-1-phosphate cytidylyltransferase
MKVAILCGGLGTRLHEESEYRPKPLVEIGGRPIVWHIMKLFAHHGLQDFVLCLGYKGNMIKEYFLNYKAMNNDFTIALGGTSAIDYRNGNGKENFTVSLVDTGADSMTGSRVKRIEEYIDDDTFLLTYGDGVSNVDIGKLLEFHKSHGKLATVTTVNPVSRFGLVEINDGNVISSFAEKPRTNGWASAGYFVMSKKVFEYLDSDPACILEDEPLKRLAAEGQLMAYRHNGFFYAMDTYREYLHLNELWKEKKAEWAVWDPSMQRS